MQRRTADSRPHADRNRAVRLFRTIRIFEVERARYGRQHSQAAEHDDHDHKPHGWRRWVYATNHKDIGTMYLVFAVHDVLHRRRDGHGHPRASCSSPGMQFVDPQFFNSMTTMHALMMIFGAVMPAWTGLANWMMPMQVGAPDMALPRLNNFSFWILPFAFTLLLRRCSCPAARRRAAGPCIRRWFCRTALHSRC